MALKESRIEYWIRVVDRAARLQRFREDHNTTRFVMFSQKRKAGKNMHERFRRYRRVHGSSLLAEINSRIERACFECALEKYFPWRIGYPTIRHEAEAIGKLLNQAELEIRGIA